MYYYEVAPAKTFHASDSLLTYHSEQPLTPGQIVTVPLGKNSCVGIVVKSVTQPDFATKPISSIVYKTPLPTNLVNALFWLTNYYAAPMSTVVQAILPTGVTKNRRRKPLITENSSSTPEDTPILNSAQLNVIKSIQASQTRTNLLHGITGSGKTNVYIKLAQDVLAAGQSVILLVPEIALTPQLLDSFSHFSQDIIVLHSRQTEAERHLCWEDALLSKKPRLVIGPRSALLAPVPNLGLVIIDEAHEPAYQQETNPKYYAPRLAATMAKTILGSATPSVADYYLAKSHPESLTTLTELAIQNDKTAQIHLIDFKERANFTRNRILSTPLINAIRSSIQNHHQSLIFHNRRGTAPLTICDHCGWQAVCSNCFLPLTLHADHFQMHCHTCGRTSKVPTVCPHCQNASIHHKGIGTKYIEAELTKLFPHARIARFDADTTSDQHISKIYNQVKAGEFDIIIGTQMIAKGFDLPLLDTLGVIQADSQLSLPDYSSEERTYQLLNQVIGRARRGHQNSNIFIQTFQPSNPIITAAINSDYQAFYTYLIQKRQKSVLPPFSFLLKLSMTYKTEEATIRNIRALNKKITQILHAQDAKQVVVSAPTPGFHERTNLGYTWQLIVKAKTRQPLLNLLAELDKNPHLHFELDPISLL